MDPFSFTVDDFDVEWLSSGMARGFDAELALHRGARRPGEVLRPAGQPPAQDRRDRAVPDRARLRAGGHGARRRRERRGVRAGAVPADGAGPVLVRRDQGAGREAGPDRAGGLLLPDVRERGRDAGQPGRQRRQPAALAQRLHRRPQPRLRCGAVGLHPRQVAGDRRAGRGRASRSASAWHRGTPSSCRTGWAASPSTRSCPGSGSRSARRRARTSRCWAWCSRCSA